MRHGRTHRRPPNVGVRVKVEHQFDAPRFTQVGIPVAFKGEHPGSDRVIGRLSGSAAAAWHRCRGVEDRRWRFQASERNAALRIERKLRVCLRALERG